MKQRLRSDRGSAMDGHALIDPLGSIEGKFTRRTTRRLVLFALCLLVICIYNFPVERRDSRPVELARDGEVVGGAKPNATDVQNEPETNIRERRLPAALIVGARKSGTRALLRFLEVNPAIRSVPREVHFFDRDANYERGLEWYRSQMPVTGRHELTIEKSPAYFVTKEAPDRVRAMNGSVKLVLILRDPVTRLISDFSQTIANRLDEDAPSSHDDYYEIRDELRADPERTSKPRSRSVLRRNATRAWQEAEKELERLVLRPDGGVDDQRPIVRTGMYSMHLERWLSVFPRDQFHFVDGERLIERPHEELQKLERFLRLVPSVIREDHFVFSTKKGFYCLRNVTEPQRGDSLRVGGSESERTLSEPICLGKTKGRRHVAMSRALTEKLKGFYAPYNEYLHSMTGINFNA